VGQFPGKRGLPALAELLAKANKKLASCYPKRRGQTINKTRKSSWVEIAGQKVFSESTLSRVAL